MRPEVIRPSDRVADVLARDEALVDVFISVSPAFERLRNPAMRKVMARLVTVEQAARVARVDPGTLLGRLNAAVTGTAWEGDASAPADAADPSAVTGPRRPPRLEAIPADRVVELDVREELRAGQEPFSRIMDARRRIPDGGALKLRAIFEPVPLYAVLAKHGLEHWTEQLGDEDWVVWFYAADAVAMEASGSPRGPADAAEEELAEEQFAEEEGVVVLDVRGLEPPEPMVRTLAALEALPPDATLVQLNVREPRFLLPGLAERGFTYEVRKQSEDLVRVFIRHSEKA